MKKPTMKYRLTELRSIMKENKIKGGSLMNKEEMIDVLREKNLLPEVDTEQPEHVHVNGVRKNPRPVTLENTETGEITSYPSLYRAGRSLHRAPHSFLYFNGRTMNGKYNVTVY